MKNHLIRSGIAALLPFFALSLTGYGQSDPTTPPTTEEAVKLPQFTVSTSAGDPYHVQDAVSLARVSGALIDTPVSINVIPKELIQDLGANAAYEAARYMPGISNGRGAGTNGGIQERFNFRGFESETRTVDNFSMTLIPAINTTIDTFEPLFVDRVELVMGPDAVLNPTGTPGGSVNIVSKSPLYTQQGSAQIEVGNYSAQKVAADVTGPIPMFGHNNLAYRIMATDQDTHTYIPGHYKKADVAVEFEYKFSEANKITFKYFGVDFQAFGNASAPNDNGWLIYDPVNSIMGRTLPNEPTTPGITYNGTNGMDTTSSTQERTNTAQLVYTGSIFDLVSVRLGGQFYEHHNVGNSADPSTTTNAEVFNETTGQVIGLKANVFNPMAVPITWAWGSTFNYMYQVENDYAANFHFVGISLQPVTGWSIQHDYQPVNHASSFVMPTDNLFAGDYSVPRPPLSTFTPKTSTKVEDTQTQLYGVTKWGFFHDRFFADVGAVREWAYVQTYNFTFPNLTTPAPGAASLPLRAYKDSTFLSGLIKATDYISLYYTFSSNASVSAFNPTPTTTIPLWSQGKSNEFGIKTEWFDHRLSVNADHFQMSQNNVISQNPAAFSSPVPVPGTVLTSNTSVGYEVSVEGGLTKNLSVIASATSMKYRDFEGRPARNIPDGLASLLVNYHFNSGTLKGLSVFAAESYSGKSPGENPENDATTGTAFTSTGAPTQPGYYIAAWHVTNAGTAYSWSRYRVSLNVDNVLNQKFGWEPASRLTVAPYPGITFRLTTTVSF
jgi:iron complex outermembrane receptor protein